MFFYFYQNFKQGSFVVQQSSSESDPHGALLYGLAPKIELFFNDKR